MYYIDIARITDLRSMRTHFAALSTQRQNECAFSANLWFERESITNAPLQSPNSRLLTQYFFCSIRYVMEEVRRNLSWKRQPYLFWFGLIHAKRKQTMGILKMPPFCRERLLTGDAHAHSFCRCVRSVYLHKFGCSMRRKGEGGHRTWQYNNRVDVRWRKYVFGPTQAHFSPSRRRGLKWVLRRAKNIFTPKNIDSITIIIISEGIQKRNQRQ